MFFHFYFKLTAKKLFISTGLERNIEIRLIYIKQFFTLNLYITYKRKFGACVIGEPWSTGIWDLGEPQKKRQEYQLVQTDMAQLGFGTQFLFF